MKISKTHQALFKELKDKKVITDPQDYLGPNWKDVLNFWFYLDTLREDDKKVTNNRYYALEDDVRGLAFDISQAASEEIVGLENCVFSCYVTQSTTKCWIFSYATYELIAQHKILEQGKSLVFLPLCMKSMKISNIHQRFSEQLNEPKVLTNLVFAPLSVCQFNKRPQNHP
jgi:hypothetical protein